MQKNIEHAERIIIITSRQFEIHAVRYLVQEKCMQTEANSGEVNVALVIHAEKSAGRGKCRQRKMKAGGNAGRGKYRRRKIQAEEMRKEGNAGRGNAAGGKCRQKEMQEGGMLAEKNAG
jgi:hypothetical protein